MVIAAIVLSATFQARSVYSDFIVETIDSSKNVIEVARSKWSNLLDVNGNSIITWKYEANGGKSGWRKDYEYDVKGEVKFHAYETWFGELKSRWILAREDGEWKLRGPSDRTVPEKKSRFVDESILWFTNKKVKVGAKANISAIDSGTFTIRKGKAIYMRDAEIGVEKGVVKTHVIYKAWEDEIQVWYFDSNGRPVRIEQSFPKSGTDFTFRLEK